jgi:Flp pilus assembly protein TadG
MLLRTAQKPRRGTHAVEAAFVYPVTFMLMIGILVCGMGIFRYQEISHWSHQAARWAACHGGQYAFENNQPLTTSSVVYTTAIQPYTVALDQTKLSYTVSYSDPGQMPTYPDLTSTGPPFKWRINEVTVTITYNWVPEAYLGGITFTSSSTMPVEY